MCDTTREEAMCRDIIQIVGFYFISDLDFSKLTPYFYFYFYFNK